MNLLQSHKWHEDCKKVPRTCAWLKGRPELMGTFPAQHTANVNLPRSAGIFRMLPGTQLRPHTGPVNFCLLVHMGIKVPPGPWLKVGDGPRREWKVGKAIAFDDSYVHSAGHEGTEPRFVLFTSIHHPGLGAPGAG